MDHIFSALRKAAIAGYNFLDMIHSEISNISFRYDEDDEDNEDGLKRDGANFFLPVATEVKYYAVEGSNYQYGGQGAREALFYANIFWFYKYYLFSTCPFSCPVTHRSTMSHAFGEMPWGPSFEASLLSMSTEDILFPEEGCNQSKKRKQIWSQSPTSPPRRYIKGQRLTFDQRRKAREYKLYKGDINNYAFVQINPLMETGQAHCVPCVGMEGCIRCSLALLGIHTGSPCTNSLKLSSNRCIPPVSLPYLQASMSPSLTSDREMTYCDELHEEDEDYLSSPEWSIKSYSSNSSAMDWDLVSCDLSDSEDSQNNLGHLDDYINVSSERLDNLELSSSDPATDSAPSLARYEAVHHYSTACGPIDAFIAPINGIIECIPPTLQDYTRRASLLSSSHPKNIVKYITELYFNHYSSQVMMMMVAHDLYEAQKAEYIAFILEKAATMILPHINNQCDQLDPSSELNQDASCENYISHDLNIARSAPLSIYYDNYYPNRRFKPPNDDDDDDRDDYPLYHHDTDNTYELDFLHKSMFYSPTTDLSDSIQPTTYNETPRDNPDSNGPDKNTVDITLEPASSFLPNALPSSSYDHNPHMTTDGFEIDSHRSNKHHDHHHNRHTFKCPNLYKLTIARLVQCIRVIWCQLTLCWQDPLLLHALD